MLSLLTNMPRDVLIQQIYDGLILMVLGIGTVFIFLILLVYCTKAMSKICARIGGEEVQAPAAKKTNSTPSAKPVQVAKSNDAAIAAAIAAAYEKER